MNKDQDDNETEDEQNQIYNTLFPGNGSVERYYGEGDDILLDLIKEIRGKGGVPIYLAMLTKILEEEKTYYFQIEKIYNSELSISNIDVIS